ncbi:EcsC family protein [Anaerobacillus sp. MEB173]|uniref:EcsC family protein n=1 Tax=Anaerobacillus sp. MEB173 TaxID=3383345 RepID=UPI003F8EAAE5
MGLTEHEQRILADIVRWENSYFQYEATDFELTYHKWMKQNYSKLKVSQQRKLLNTVDNFLFHLHSLIQNSTYQQEASERILDQARIFNRDIQTIQDMQYLKIEQLIYIVNQQIAKQRLVSFAQGGLAGMGGLLLLGTDLAAVVAINLRSIQLIASTYGYDLKRPNEMMLALKLFHASTLPKGLQHEAWLTLEKEIVQYEDEWQQYFYSGEDDAVTDVSWLQQPIRQIVKAIIIVALRKKLIQGVPLLGMAFGATMNYQLARQTTEFAHRFYQKRFLLEKA